MVIKQHFDWLRHIEKALVDLDEIPLFGYTPSFEIDKFCTQLSQLLQIPDLKIELGNWSWHTPDSLQESLGRETSCVNMSVLPFLGHVSLFITSSDLNSFVSWIVEHKSGSNNLISPYFSEGLLNFVIMESMHIAQNFPLFKNFLLRIIGEVERSSLRSLVLDIKLKAYDEEIICKLSVLESFRKQWLNHFAKKPKNIPTHLMQGLDVVCSLEAARVVFTHHEWKKIRIGDFIPLRSCNLDLENGSGSLYLSVGQKPLLRVRIKEKGLKILEQPIYQEDIQSMDDDHEDLFSEISDLEKEKKQTLDPIPEDSDEEKNEELELSLEEEEGQEESKIHKEKSPLQKIEMVPLNVVVEVARFKMTCEKLIQLKPGNLLELNVALEKPVDLVVNGKKIATGELVRIGDSLGVQVTEVG